jgi:hypothetical protein
MAIRKLRAAGFPVVAVGSRPAMVEDVTIVEEIPANQDIHTVTLYLSAANQESWRDKILQLNPKRVIFNPGTENPTFQAQLTAMGIEPLHACTLVMLSTNQYA